MSSYLLWVEEQRVVADTGTFGYIPGERRQYARGVGGHSTVQVGDTEPIPIGGAYLMGPRPTPHSRRVDGEQSLIEMTYRGRPYRAPDYTHHRAVYAGDEWWLISDTVAGHEGRPLRSRIQLHPTIDPDHRDDDIRVTTGAMERTLTVLPLTGNRLRLHTGQYFPRFGEEMTRPVGELRATPTDNGPSHVSYLLSLHDDPPESVTFRRGRKSRPSLEMDGNVAPLPPCHLRPNW